MIGQQEISKPQADNNKLMALLQTCNVLPLEWAACRVAETNSDAKHWPLLVKKKCWEFSSELLLHLIDIMMCIDGVG